jgi:hypothetical protein
MGMAIWMKNIRRASPNALMVWAEHVFSKQ